jgi:rod shape-determining protein MreC
VIRLSIPFRQALARLTLPVLAVLAFGLILIGKADVVIEQYLSAKLSDVLAPLYGVVAAPLDAARAEMTDVAGLWSLRKENRRLRAENQQLRRWQAVAMALDAENNRLKVTSRWSNDAAEKFVTVPVVADNGGVYARSVLVSTGPHSPIAAGQIALDTGGLVGRVIEVGSRSARILLITDLNSRVPVTLADSRGHAMLLGNNGPRPRLMYWEDGDAPKEGEQVVTSAEAGAYPAGLPVGSVHYISVGEAELIPDADLSRLELVRVVDYGVTDMLPPETPHPAVKAAVK